MTPFRVLLAVPVVLAVTLLAALAWPHVPAAGPGRQSITDPALGVVTVDPAVEVLREWDERRAQAWAEGDVAALRALYVAGSRAGAADAALLGEYAERRVSVTGLRLQLLSVEVVERSPERCVLVVTDRLAGVLARHAGRALPLPADRPSTHRIALVRAGEVWLVEEVRPAPQPAR